jgi:hypothetical protein
MTTAAEKAEAKAALEESQQQQLDARLHEIRHGIADLVAQAVALGAKKADVLP